jgi:metallophosphoesterase superfamily enzyme
MRANESVFSTSTSTSAGTSVRLVDGLVLDGRLALFHERDRWLAVADLHFGFEAGRRRDGALWPLWGMESVASRLLELIRHYRPVTLVLVGDVVDGAVESAAACEWLASLRDLGPELVLIAGNHDRGPVMREFSWVDSWTAGDFFFEHGHLASSRPALPWRVRGHLHPSVRIGDGAGTTLRLPALVIEENEDGSRELRLPAFSPWAGGGHHLSCQPERVRRWACSPRRVFEVAE